MKRDKYFWINLILGFNPYEISKTNETIGAPHCPNCKKANPKLLMQDNKTKCEICKD